MHRHILSAVSFALGFLALGLPAMADPITVGASASVDELVCSAETTPQPDQCTGSFGGGAATATANVDADVIVGSAQASVSVSTDHLRPSVHLAVSASNSSSLSSTSTASAGAIITDALSISGAPVTARGHIFFAFRLTGDVVIGGSELRTYCLDLILPSVSDFYCASNTGVSSTSNAFTFALKDGGLVAELFIPYTDDGFALAAEALDFLTFGFEASVSAHSGETASLDFSNTLVITEISVRDENGNLVPGLTLTSAAGFAYPFLNAAPQAPDEVPEPATLAVLGTALAGLILRRSFRQP